MALVCSLPTNPTNSFSFIDCQSISISYEITGLATVSFTVISTSSTIDLRTYSTVYFGSNVGGRSVPGFSAGRVMYSGYINSYELSRIPGTSVYEHKLSLIAWGCRA